MKVVVAFLLLVALAGCGSGDDGGEGGGGGAEAQLDVTAVDFAFEPASLQLDEGGARLMRIES